MELSAPSSTIVNRVRHLTYLSDFHAQQAATQVKKIQPPTADPPKAKESTEQKEEENDKDEGAARRRTRRDN